MYRRTTSAARLAAVALLVGLATVACARHGSSATAAPAVSSAVEATLTSQTAQIATPTPNAAGAGSPSAPTYSSGASAAGSAEPSSTPAAGKSPTAAITPDPLDSELQTLDQILGGVDSSLSGSGPGGE